MLEVKNITKIYQSPTGPKKKLVLDNVSFSLKEEEVTGLIGPNGAGKTTLIKILGLLTTPDAGRIFFNGQEIFGNRLAFLGKAGILLGEQISYLYEGLTCLENLKLFAALKNIFGRQALKEIEFLAELLNLKEVLALKVRHTSTGFKKRLILAIALLGDPPVLLLDEPLSGVDPENAFYLRNLIKEVGRKKTILWSSHNLSEIEKVCQKIHFLKNGRLIFSGTFCDLARLGCAAERNYQNDLEKVFISALARN